MPRDKRDPAARKPSPYEGAGSEAINAMVARTVPAILELLADGVSRSRPAIVAALAGRHAKDDVVHTLIRLAVTGQVVETGGQYALAASPRGGGASRGASPPAGRRSRARARPPSPVAEPEGVEGKSRGR